MSVLTPHSNRTDRKRFCVDVPFTIVPDSKAVNAKSGDLELDGYASTWMEDRDGETVAPDAFTQDLAQYMDNPVYLWQHNQDWPIGSIKTATVDDNGLRVKVVVTKPMPGEEGWRFTAYEQIKRKVVKTMSIGGFMWRELRFNPDDPEEMPQIVITRVQLLEVSAVSIPANPGSLFDAAVKSIKGAAHGPILTPEASDEMSQLIGFSTLEHESLKAMTDEERDSRFQELAQVYRRAGVLPPERDDWAKVIAARTAGQLTALEMLEASVKVFAKLYGYVATERKSTPATDPAVLEQIHGLGETIASLQDQVDQLTSGKTPTARTDTLDDRTVTLPVRVRIVMEDNK